LSSMPDFGKPNPAPSAPSVGDAAVVEVDESTFQELCVKASIDDGPVLCDFYADWCGPCKTLTPRLEKVVLDANGTVRLAKIDVDKNPQIAQMFGVQSLPTVAVLWQGKVLDVWSGVKSEEEILECVERYETAAGKVNPERLLGAAAQLLQEGDVDAAVAAYQGLAANDATRIKATAGLAMCAIAQKDFEGAQAIIGTLSQGTDPTPPEVLQVKSVVGIALDAAQSGESTTELAQRRAANEQDWEALHYLALKSFSEGDYKAGLGDALRLMQNNRGYNEDAGRKLALQMFDALGPNHELTLAGRRTLARLLFA